MNYAELVSRDPKELRILAAKYGIRTHHKFTADKLAKLIVEHITAKPVQTESMKHMAEAPKAPSLVHTEEEVLDVIKAYAAKEGFQVKFPGDDTWIFKCRGAEESGHMSCLLRIIKMKAESVSKGARKPFIVKNSNGEDVMMAGI